MNRIIRLLTIVVLCYVITFDLCAINPQLVVDQSHIKVSPLPPDRVKLDYNGDTLAIVSVTSPVDNLVFEGNIFGDMDKDASGDIYIYTFYVVAGNRNIRVEHNNYLSATIKFDKVLQVGLYDGIEVIPVSTEVAKLEGEKADNTHIVTIKSDDFAYLMVDNRPMPQQNISSQDIQLDEGTHYITTQYKDVIREIKTDVNYDETVIDAVLSGILKLTGVGGVPVVTPLNDAPAPELLSHDGNIYVYGHMLGDYNFSSEGSYDVLNNTVHKKVSIQPRSESVYRINEMTRFGFFAYHATPKQYLGFSVGGCRKFGWYAAFRLDLISSVDTPYGKFDLVNIDATTGEEKSVTESTCWSIITGPMFRLYRKLYMQVGGGLTRYLQTDTPGILTEDFSYESCAVAEAGLYFRNKAVLFGVGYSKQFTVDAYTSGLNNQITFSLGFTL